MAMGLSLSTMSALVHTELDWRLARTSRSVRRWE